MKKMILAASLGMLVFVGVANASSTSTSQLINYISDYAEGKKIQKSLKFNSVVKKGVKQTIKNDGKELSSSWEWHGNKSTTPVRISEEFTTQLKKFNLSLMCEDSMTHIYSFKVKNKVLYLNIYQDGGSGMGEEAVIITKRKPSCDDLNDALN